MIIAILLCVAGLGLALWILIRKVDAIPQRLWTLARDEHARDDGRAQTVLQEAAAARIGPMVLGLRGYHEQLASAAREQVAAAEMRARVAERRSSDTAAALGAASELVRDLRALLDESAARAAVAPGRSSRTSSPSVAPTGSVQQLSPEAALVAAGLVPRPSARGLPPIEALDAPPVRIGAPRKETTIGLAPHASAPSDDAERSSDDDVTRVGSRTWSGTDATLPCGPAGVGAARGDRK